MLERNKSVLRRERFETNRFDITPFVESFKVQIEKFDFESLGCFEYKLEILKALDNQDFDLVCKRVQDISRMLEKCGTDDYGNATNLIMKAEQLKRLVKT